MTPRSLRTALQNGTWTAVDPAIYRRAPEPPAEYPEWRRDRCRVAIHAALLFLRGKSWTEIAASMEKRSLLEKERGQVKGAIITKQRVSQYCRVGVKLLMFRGCFRPVRNP